MTAMLAATLIVVSTTDIGGLPALPAICIGFLAPNADLLWHALRRGGRAPVRIYGRTDTSFYDLDADVIERGPAAVVVLTRDRPPVMATIEPVRDGESFTAVPADARRGAPVPAEDRRRRRRRGARPRPPERHRDRAA